MTVPRSKIKTGYYRRVPVRSFVVQLDLSFLLTQPVFVIGLVSVAPRRCATACPRASGPTIGSSRHHDLGAFTMN